MDSMNSDEIEQVEDLSSKLNELVNKLSALQTGEGKTKEEEIARANIEIRSVKQSLNNDEKTHVMQRLLHPH